MAPRLADRNETGNRQAKAYRYAHALTIHLGVDDAAELVRTDDLAAWDRIAELVGENAASPETRTVIRSILAHAAQPPALDADDDDPFEGL